MSDTMRQRRAGALTLALMATAFGAPARLAAQRPIALEDALRQADATSYANRIASGASRERSADALEALRGMLPTVRLESGYMRTTDPIGAFGTLLRQRSITQSDFDPARLNDPAAMPTYSGAVVVEQPLLNLDAWVGRSAASRATEATRQSEAWTRLSTRVDVIRAYFGAVLAAEKVETLDAATSAAHGHVRQAESMAEQGLVTRSDALLASVKAGEVDADRIGAAGDVESARRALATLLGTPADTAFVLPVGLPPAAALRERLAPALATEQAPRSDVQAAELGASAARLDVRRAMSQWLPRVNAFGRYDWYSDRGVYAGPESWTLGVMATWTPLAGGAQAAAVRRARGRADAAEAQADAAVAQAALERERTATELRVALERLEIAERSVAQAEEAHRIVTRKYEGGLSTVIELLDAAAVETKTRLQRSAAAYAAIVAGAERLRALGRDPGALAGLELRIDPERESTR